MGPKPFERFRAAPDHQQKNAKDGPSDQEQEKPQQPELPDNVIPLRPKTVAPEKALVDRPGLPLLGVLDTIKRESHKILLGLGRRLYARMRKDQDKSKLRKGVIIDHKA
jgi:hypothetical protein